MCLWGWKEQILQSEYRTQRRVEVLSQWLFLWSQVLRVASFSCSCCTAHGGGKTTDRGALLSDVSHRRCQQEVKGRCHGFHRSDGCLDTVFWDVDWRCQRLVHHYHCRLLQTWAIGRQIVKLQEGQTLDTKSGPDGWMLAPIVCWKHTLPNQRVQLQTKVWQ